MRTRNTVQPFEMQGPGDIFFLKWFWLVENENTTWNIDEQSIQRGKTYDDF